MKITAVKLWKHSWFNLHKTIPKSKTNLMLHVSAEIFSTVPCNFIFENNKCSSQQELIIKHPVVTFYAEFLNVRLKRGDVYSVNSYSEKQFKLKSSMAWTKQSNIIHPPDEQENLMWWIQHKGFIGFAGLSWRLPLTGGSKHSCGHSSV